MRENLLKFQRIPGWDINQAAVGLLATDTDDVIGAPPHQHMFDIYAQVPTAFINKLDWMRLAKSPFEMASTSVNGARWWCSCNTGCRPTHMADRSECCAPSNVTYNMQPDACRGGTSSLKAIAHMCDPGVDTAAVWRHTLTVRTWMVSRREKTYYVSKGSR